MTNPAVNATPSSRPVVDSIFGGVWPDAGASARPRLVASALLVGLLGAAVLPFRDHGLGTFLVLAAVSGVVAVAARDRMSGAMVGSAVLCLLLTATLLFRDAEWIVVLCLMATFAVGAAALTEGRSVNGLVASSAAVPLAALRGLPWLGRSVTVPGKPASYWPVIRTVTDGSACW